MKKLLSALLATLLAGVFSIPASGQWSLPGASESDVGLSIVDNFATTGAQASKLFAIVKNGKFGSMPEEVLCDEIGTGDCDFSINNPSGNALLPACVDLAQEDCVESLVVAEEGVNYEAVFVRQAEGPTRDAIPALGLPQASTVSLWELPAEYSGPTPKTIAVHANLNVGGMYKGKIMSSGFTATVTPYELQYRSDYAAPEVVQITQESGRRAVGTRSAPADCFFAETGVCGIGLDFPEGVKVSLKIRLTNQVGGWFRGRMKNTSIVASEFSETADTIVVTGDPVETPRIGFAIPQATAPEGFVDDLKALSPGWIGGVSNTRADSSLAWKFLSLSRGVLEEKASGVVRVWEFGTTRASANRCLSDKSKVLGIVTTNATVYQAGAPNYSKGFLDYKVGGLHYLPDGESVFEGSYDLVMRSEVARCLYGFSSAPISATISVSGTGDKTVSTTVVSEKNGWLKLAASGFTFSEKTVKVKLSQKKKTITCVSKTNKKKTKKVTGYSPKCPSGYKKK